MLTELKIKNAGPGNWLDERGLYLQVNNAGDKSWLYKFQLNGRRREMGLGSLADVPAKAARRRTAEARALVLAGVDPIEARKSQGSQYTSDHFQRLLAAQGIACSMSRAGEVWDNSAMESFFSTMKTERVSRKIYRTRSEARSDVFDYIESFYNPKRRHSTLGYISPVQFEEAQFA